MTRSKQVVIQPWGTVRLSTLQAGEQLQCDGGFTCVNRGEVVTVHEADDGLYFRCSGGRHYLRGHLDEDGCLVGLRRNAPSRRADTSAGVIQEEGETDMTESELHELFSKPSTLLRAALEDLERVEILPEYIVDMGTWHTPRVGGGGVCAVCLAGSVMAMRLGCHRNLVEVPHSSIFHKLFVGGEPTVPALDYAERLYALEALRHGHVKLYVEAWWSGIPMKDVDKDEMPDYKESPADFKQAMRAILAQLEAAGV